MELEEFKEFLGPAITSQYSEDELPQLRREIYAMAELLLDIYLSNKRSKSAANHGNFDRPPSPNYD